MTTEILECVDGPYAGQIITVPYGVTVLEVRAFDNGRSPAAWYRVHTVGTAPDPERVLVMADP